MDSRPATLTVTCVGVAVTAALSMIGFGLLLVGRSAVDTNLKLYLAREGYSARDAGYDESGAMAAEFVSGAVVSAVILGLAVLTLVARGNVPRFLTLGAVCVYLPWAFLLFVDGLGNIAPDERSAAVYPGWFFPLHLVQGGLALAIYLPAVVLLATSSPGPRAVRTGTWAAGSASSPSAFR